MKNIEVYTDLIGKYLAGEMDPAEQAELMEWVNEKTEHQRYYAEIVEVWEKSAAVGAPDFHTDLGSAWEKIDRATNGQSSGSASSSDKIIPLSKKVGLWSIAAAILIAVGIGLWWFARSPAVPELIESRTASGEKKELTLPDGSLVWLNENSTLTYSEGFEPRIVTLTGEAFFSVERMEDAPFRITSGEAVTTVLGTSFVVRAYPDEDRVEVTVETGKVALAVAKQQENTVILPAGTSGVVYRSEQKVETVEKMENADAWKTGKLEFDEIPLERVFIALERYFDTEITVTDERMLSCPYTSSFDRPDLESILSVISATFGYEVSENDKGFILAGNGCQPD